MNELRSNNKNLTKGLHLMKPVIRFVTHSENTSRLRKNTINNRTSFNQLFLPEVHCLLL
jgi:hypothetical protein